MSSRHSRYDDGDLRSGGGRRSNYDDRRSYERSKRSSERDDDRGYKGRSSGVGDRSRRSGDSGDRRSQNGGSSRRFHEDEVPQRTRRRGFRYDSPPKDIKPTSGLLPPPFMSSQPGPTTSIPSELSAQAMINGASSDDVKAMKEVYVGNYSSNMTPSQIGDFVGSTMLAMKMNVAAGSPIVRAWSSQDQQFVFLELRTIEESNNCMELSGLSCANHELVIGRTKGYPQKMLTYPELQKPTIKANKTIKGGLAALAAAHGPSTSFSQMSTMQTPSGGFGLGPQGTGVLYGGNPTKMSMSMAANQPHPNNHMANPNNLNQTGGFSLNNQGSHMGLQVMKNNITQAPEVLAITGLPPLDVLDEDGLLELLETFGAVREVIHIPFGKLVSVGEGSTMAAATMGSTKPMGQNTDIDASVVLVSYQEPNDGVSVRDYLHGWSWGNGKYRLTVGLADTLWSQIKDTDEFLKVSARYESMCKNYSKVKKASLTEVPSRCLWLPSVLSYSECQNDELYAELLEDLEDEIRLFSDVWDLKIPKPVAKQLYPESQIREWKRLGKTMKIVKEEPPRINPTPPPPASLPAPPPPEDPEQDVDMGASDDNIEETPEPNPTTTTTTTTSATDAIDENTATTENEGTTPATKTEVKAEPTDEDAKPSEITRQDGDTTTAAASEDATDYDDEENEQIPLDLLPFDINDSDVGHCYVEFASVSDATRIRNLFNGRTYNERPVVFHYFNEELMFAQKFTNPCPLYSLHGSSLFSEKLQRLHKVRRKEVQEERDDRRQRDERAIAVREENREKERQELRRLEAEAELMAAEEVARRKQIQMSAMQQEMGTPQIHTSTAYANVAVSAGTNVAAAQTSGKLLQDDDSDMGIDD